MVTINESPLTEDYILFMKRRQKISQIKIMNFTPVTRSNRIKRTE